MKYKLNITLLEARREVEIYMKENMHSVRQQTRSKKGNHKNRILIEELLHLSLDDWLKCQEQLKNYTYV